MKKVLALILSLVLLICSVCPAGAADYPLNLYLIGMSEDGEYYTPIPYWDMSVCLTLYDDGCAKIVVVEETEKVSEGTWEEDSGTLLITINDILMTIPASESGYVGRSEGLFYLFSTSPMPSVNAASSIAASDISDFDGTWKLTQITARNLDLDNVSLLELYPQLDDYMNMSDDNSRLVIDNGQASLFSSKPLQFTFADGTLLFSFEGEEGESMNRKIELSSQDELVYTLLENLILRFKKVQ